MVVDREGVPQQDETFYDQGYRAWKHWNETFRPSELDARYFAGEFAGHGLKGARVLEIGFGAGAFLAWAAGQGALVSGCELIRDLCEEGKAKGFDTRYGSLEVFGSEEHSFDLIVALDVLEHIEIHELPGLLRQVAHLLRPGGRMIVRTPNGASPWGLLFQNGDMSHVTRLSPGVYEQVSLGSGLQLEECRNAFRVLDPRHPMKDRLRFAVRDLINRVVAFAYGFWDAPLDPNLVAVFRRPDTAEHP